MVEADIDDLKLVAARRVDAGGGRDQVVDLLHVGVGALLEGIRRLAVLGRNVDVVDGDRHVQFLQLARPDDRRRLGAGGIVLGRFGILARGRGRRPAGRGALSTRDLVRRGGRAIGRRIGIAVLGFRRLLGFHDGPVGIESDLFLGRRGRVELGRDHDAGGARADNAFDDALQALAQAFLDLGLVLGARPVDGRVVLAADGQGVAAVIEQGHVVGLEVRHRAGNQVADGANLVARQVGARDTDDDRGGRLGGLVLEQLTLGHDQVDARRGDAVEGLDGARQLAFQGALVVEVLHELGLAKRRRIVENFVTDRAGGRQALAGQQQARLVDGFAVDHDRRTIALQLILDAGLVQVGRDLLGFFKVEIGIEQRFRLGADVQKHGRQDGGHAGAGTENRGQTADAEALQGLKKGLHGVFRPHHHHKGRSVAGASPKDFTRQ